MYIMSPSPFLFSKCLKCLVKYVREKGVRLALFLDDGWGVNRTFDLTLKDAEFVESVLLQAGFLINYDKSVLIPTQILEWLGLLWTLLENKLSIPDRRLLSASQVLKSCTEKLPFLSAREIARFTGKVISMMPDFGNIHD